MDVKRILLISLSIVTLFFGTVCHAEDKLSINYLTPAYEDSPFYIKMGNIMRVVADDLGIEFDMAYGKNSTLLAKRLGLGLIKSNKPDYFLTGYYNDTTNDFLEYTKTTETKIFLITAQPPNAEYKKIGKPRERYSQWIGQLTPNDKRYGYLLADKLIQLAKKAGLTDEKGKVNEVLYYDSDGNERSQKTRAVVVSGPKYSVAP